MIFPANYHARTGDIYACWGTDLVARGISAETSLLSLIVGPSQLRWSPSHVAIACEREGPNNRNCYWFESTTLTNRHCLEYGQPVAGVQCHQVRDRLKDYVMAGGRVDVYRPTKLNEFVGCDAFDLRRILLSLCGEVGGRLPVSYDMFGAAFSGTRILKYSPFCRANTDTMFCSELLAAVLQRFCLLNRDNPAKYHPGLLMRQLVRQGTYSLHTRFEKSSEVIL